MAESPNVRRRRSLHVKRLRIVSTCNGGTRTSAVPDATHNQLIVTGSNLTGRAGRLHVLLNGAVLRHGGKYFNVGTPGQLRAASMTIDSVEKGWLVQTQYSRNRPVHHYFVIPAIAFLTAALMLRAIPFFVDLT